MAHPQKMFGALLVALLLTLGVSVPAAPAQACGGYGALDPDEEAIRAVALRSVTGQRHRRGARYVATIVERTDRRALVRVQDVAPGAGSAPIELEVSRADSGWRVTGRTIAAVARR